MHMAGFAISLFVWSASGAIIAHFGYKLHKKRTKKLKRQLLITGILVAEFAGLLAAFINGTYNVTVLIQNALFAAIIAFVCVAPLKRYKKQVKKYYKNNKQRISLSLPFL